MDSQTGIWGYGYDQLNRLLTATASAGVYSGLTLTEGYDSFGDRKSQVASGTYGGAVPQPSPVTFTGSNNNRVDQWRYDAAGDVVSDGTNMYAYDAEGRQTGMLNSLSGLNGYIYDAEGRRVEKAVVNGYAGPNPQTVVENQYLLGLDGEQVSVLGPNGSWKWTNVYAGSKQLATYDSSGTHFALTDRLGTKRVELSVTSNSAVTSTEQCLSLPYGDGLDCNGTDINQLHYTGKQHDTESTNDYFGARYYNSNTAARFLTPDWAKNPQGVPYADFTNPQSLNLYSYAGNNPISRIDQDGHGYICIPCLIASVENFTAGHPRTVQATEGVGKIVLGGALVGTAALGDEPGAVTGGAIAADAVKTFNAALTGASTLTSGVTDIAGAATGTDVSQAQQGLSATSNVGGLLTTVATGGNLQTGQAAATITDAAQLATKPQEALKNPATIADAVKTGAGAADLVRNGASALRGALSPTPILPPTPKPPTLPACAVHGSC